MSHSRRPIHALRAFTLLESLLLLSVLSVVGVGVAIGLQSSVDITEADDQSLAIATELISEAENWRAVVFGAAPWPASLPYTVTDTITMSVGGKTRTYARITTIQNWDPNNVSNNASPQPNFAQVQITINGQVLTAYLCKLI